jgi:hypothetical protein
VAGRNQLIPGLFAGDYGGERRRSGLIGRIVLLLRPKAPKYLAPQPQTEMFHRVLQIEGDGTGIDSKALGNLIVRNLLDMSGDKNLTAAFGKF